MKNSFLLVGRAMLHGLLVIGLQVISRWGSGMKDLVAAMEKRDRGKRGQQGELCEMI
jgi:hypothetical protein